VAIRREEEHPKRNRLEMELEAYLELQKLSKKFKYEYLDGYAYALAGGSNAHDTISGNAFTMLDTILADDGLCKPHGPNVQVAVNEDRYVYPDAFVTCDQEGLDDKATQLHAPTLVIEVLSPGTQDMDQNEKLLLYQSIPSVHTYMLVSSEVRRVQVYQRTGSEWIYEVFHAGQSITIRAIDITLPVNRFYRRTQVV
jgi:Uma2 family endonuclease